MELRWNDPRDLPVKPRANCRWLRDGKKPNSGYLLKDVMRCSHRLAQRGARVQTTAPCRPRRAKLRYRFGDGAWRDNNRRGWSTEMADQGRRGFAAQSPAIQNDQIPTPSLPANRPFVGSAAISVEALYSDDCVRHSLASGSQSMPPATGQFQSFLAHPIADRLTTLEPVHSRFRRQPLVIEQELPKPYRFPLNA